MNKPDYQRAFNAEDFRGYFTWDKHLTTALGSFLYHACHKDEINKILKTDELALRSEWSLIHPEFGEWSSPCVWCGLNYFNQGNYYGPFLISFPLTVLDGRTFMVFRRTGEMKRYFFVEYEACIPIYKKKGKVWRRVKASAYFEDFRGGFDLKANSIYDLAITRPIPMKGATITGTNHPKCIPGKCEGYTQDKSRAYIHTLAQKELRKLIETNSTIKEFVNKYPQFKLSVEK